MSMTQVFSLSQDDFWLLKMDFPDFLCFGMRIHILREADGHQDRKQRNCLDALLFEWIGETTALMVWKEVKEIHSQRSWKKIGREN